MATELIADVRMPRLSDSMEQGTIVRWLRAIGEAIELGDELVEIETDKATMVYESDVAGTLLEIVAGEGATVTIGVAIARVGRADRNSSPRRSQLKVSPVARRLAAEFSLDLTAVSGTGPGGRIVKADVERASGAVQRAAPDAVRVETATGNPNVVELTKLQRVVARRMTESKTTAPHFYLETEVDMTRTLLARSVLKAGSSGKAVPTLTDMVVKASAIALREFPRANGSYRDGAIELHDHINVGIAVAASNTLVVPVVVDADRKGLREIAAETRVLAARVRDGSVTPPELASCTFTVSNLGMYGVTNFVPVLNPPQAAILAVGAITKRPVVRDGQIAIADILRMTLACDHRVLYGADGAEFLGRIRAILEEPVALAI